MGCDRPHPLIQSSLMLLYMLHLKLKKNNQKVSINISPFFGMRCSCLTFVLISWCLLFQILAFEVNMEHGGNTNIISVMKVVVLQKRYDIPTGGCLVSNCDYIPTLS